MPERMDVTPGTLSLMVLKTLQVLGPLHGYAIAQRIKETSKGQIDLNYGTLYSALVKLEQEGAVDAAWRRTEHNRRAKYYALTPAGQKRLAHEASEWTRTADLIAAFMGLTGETA